MTGDTDGPIHETIGFIDDFDESVKDMLTLLDNLPVGIILKDRSYKYRYCNEAYASYQT